MWIKRDEFIAMQRENAGLAATVESKTAEASRVNDEIAYWRERFEREQRRADRVCDLAFEAEGRAPVTDLGREERKLEQDRMSAAMKKATEQAIEMYGDVIPDDEDETSSETDEIEPELLESLTQGLQELKRG